jgi:hypothetical protein
MIAIARVAATLVLLLAVGVPRVGAQVVDEQGCSDVKEQIRYLVSEGAFIQDAGLKNGVDLLANAKMLRDAVCGTPGDDSSPAPAPPITEPPPTPAPAPTPAFRPVDPIADTDNSATRRDACLLVTEQEVGAAMKQGVTANEADPAGVEGAQGCEFNGAALAYTDIMYFQAQAAFVYDAFHSTAEANGVQAVPGLGDRAFTYLGGNGPGVVVAKGDKLFTMEFSGIGNGPSERTSLLTLAQQAVGRVH